MSSSPKETIQKSEADNSNTSREDKFCRVCSDKALGYNFNAITCESCKAFFRRNALKTKEFKCPFKNDCQIDVVTRRFCQKCRLKKCFDIGMKKEWILSDEEKQSKKKKIEENRKRRLTSDDDLSSDGTVPKISIQQSRPAMAAVDPLCSPLQIKSEEAEPSGIAWHPPPQVSPHVPSHQLLQPSPPSLPPITTNIDSTLLQQSPSIFLIPSPSAMASGALDDPSNGTGGTLDTFINPAVLTNMSEYDGAKIVELHEANKCITDSPDTWKEISNPSLIDVVNMTDNAVRRMIRMAKRINSFKSLTQDDQIALLKGGCTELMILRSVMSYDTEKDCWPVPRNNLRLDVLKEAKGNVYEEHKKYMNSFNAELRSDDTIMLLLTAGILLNPKRPHLVNQHDVERSQREYYELLQRYLAACFPVEIAAKHYRHLMDRLDALHDLHDNHVRIFLEVHAVNPREVEPLVIELFDLK